MGKQESKEGDGMNDDKKCAICGRAFKWGADEDSGLAIKAGGPTCSENAYWKLNGHMTAEHSDQFFTCPRAAEGFGSLREMPAFWDAEGTCSYCGSISPEKFFEAVKAGAKLGPTDKNYKVYIDLPNPNAGEPTIYSSSNCDEPPGPGYVEATPEICAQYGWRNWGAKWVKPEPALPTLHEKFYFQHFSQEQRKQFVEMMNAKSLNLDYPGYFYRLPFFAVPLPKDGEQAA